MLDIDHFKRFNDTYGHNGGDTLLHSLGRFLQQHIRGEDIACRYGGEEFTLILPEASLQETFRRAEQIRRGIQQLSVEHYEHLLPSITVSLGVAAFPVHGTTSTALLKMADRALYLAKAAGRNRVVTADALDSSSAD
jgi:diguanylate cyclase (GGDEF)-like protein